MKIDRREPVNLFRVKRKRRLRDHIPMAAVAKYAALTLVGILLFRAGQAHALVERGYEALGGEAFALFLPALYWMVSRVARDILNAREDKVNVRSGKKNVLTWVQKNSHGDNHYLDCEVYAAASADILGVRELYLEDIAQAPTPPEPAPAPEEEWIKTHENWI